MKSRLVRVPGFKIWVRSSSRKKKLSIIPSCYYCCRCLNYHPRRNGEKLILFIFNAIRRWRAFIYYLYSWHFFPSGKSTNFAFFNRKKYLNIFYRLEHWTNLIFTDSIFIFFAIGGHFFCARELSGYISNLAHFLVEEIVFSKKCTHKTMSIPFPTLMPFGMLALLLLLLLLLPAPHFTVLWTHRSCSQTGLSRHRCSAPRTGRRLSE